jgi:hypothetical protein
MTVQQQCLADIMHRLARINSAYFRDQGIIPPSILIVPEDTKLDVIPIEALALEDAHNAIRNALVTVTCLEAMVTRQPCDAPIPSQDEIEHDPDTRPCIVYLAQGCDGTRACAVQYILRPEHGRATLSPLKMLTGREVAIMGSPIADMTRPGQASHTTRH